MHRPRTTPTGSLFAALWRTIRDRDYRPHYQDEYQRLWHEAAAERDDLRARIDRAVELCPAPAYHATHNYCPGCPWVFETKDGYDL